MCSKLGIFNSMSFSPVIFRVGLSEVLDFLGLVLAIALRLSLVSSNPTVVGIAS